MKQGIPRKAAATRIRRGVPCGIDSAYRYIRTLHATDHGDWVSFDPDDVKALIERMKERRGFSEK